MSSAEYNISSSSHKYSLKYFLSHMLYKIIITYTNFFPLFLDHDYGYTSLHEF